VGCAPLLPPVGGHGRAVTCRGCLQAGGSAPLDSASPGSHCSLHASSHCCIDTAPAMQVHTHHTCQPRAPPGQTMVTRSMGVVLVLRRLLSSASSSGEGHGPPKPVLFVLRKPTAAGAPSAHSGGMGPHMRGLKSSWTLRSPDPRRPMAPGQDAGMGPESRFTPRSSTWGCEQWCARVLAQCLGHGTA